jgi:hypothetical protein
VRAYGTSKGRLFGRGGLRSLGVRHHQAIVDTRRPMGASTVAFHACSRGDSATEGRTSGHLAATVTKDTNVFDIEEGI